MDAQKLGAFICKQRKACGMTQAELAEKLQITDKAVSRWERGVGLPDINLIEPLADALKVSVLEVMRSEKLEKTSISVDEVSAAMTVTFDLLKEQKKKERRAIMRLTVGVVLVLLLIFLVDTMTWMGFLGVFLPAFSFCASVILVIYIIWRKKNRLPVGQTVAFLIAVLLLQLALVLGLFVAGLLGIGPVPR